MVIRKQVYIELLQYYVVEINLKDFRLVQLSTIRILNTHTQPYRLTEKIKLDQELNPVEHFVDKV